MSKIYQCPEKDMSNLAKKKQQINKQKTEKERGFYREKVNGPARS